MLSRGLPVLSEGDPFLLQRGPRVLCKGAHFCCKGTLCGRKGPLWIRLQSPMAPEHKNGAPLRRTGALCRGQGQGA